MVVDIFAGQILISSLVLRTQRAAEDARRYAGSRQLCLLALSHSDRHVRASLLCAWPRCAVLCCAVVDARWQHPTVAFLGAGHEFMI